MKQGKVLALGPHGTNGHQVATMLKPGCRMEYCQHNSDVLRGVHGAKALFGVVPVENSTSGRISEVIKFWMDLPVDYSGLYVIGGTDLPVRHCLMVHPKSKRTNNLKLVLSHPEALGQCQGSLREMGLFGQPANSTAEAARIVSESDPDEGLGAIASEFTARVYGLKIRQRNFHDVNHNSTRFHLIGREKIGKPSGNDLTPLIFWLNDKPGALHRATGIFDVAGINMVSIHSIPIGHLRYAFYVEIQGHQDDEIVSSALVLLKNFSKRLIILGSYQQK